MGPADEGVARYEPLIRRFAATLVPANDFDDAMQDGRLAVWQALESHEPGRASELTWVFDSVRRRIIDGQRRRTKYNRATREGQPYVWSLSWLIGEDDGHPITLGESLAADTTDDPECRALLAVAFDKFRKKLSPADRELVYALLSGETARHYAERIGVTESRIGQRVKVLRERLRRYI